MKKFLEIIKDPAITLIMVVGVIAYPLFYAIPYSTEVIRETPISVVDMDNSQLSREFIRNIDATDSIKVISKTTTNIEAEKDFYKDEIKGFINIPKDFEKNIKQGKQTNLSLYVDSSYLIIYKAIYSKTMETALEMGAKIEIAKMIKQGIPTQKAIAIKQPFEFIQIPLYNIAGGYATYAYPMILILIMHQTL
ncbi:ABC transporter permease, partial [bacterium]|nr:ABC transporter permease [bacterium]